MTVSAQTQVTVQYERKLSDGQYGSEGFSLSMTYTTDSADVTSEYVLDRAEITRRWVLQFLGRSASVRVADVARQELGPADDWPEVTMNPPDLEDLPY